MIELVKRAKNGDKEAFTNLVISYQSELFKIARAKINNVEDINDVIQETMLIAFDNVGKLKDETNKRISEVVIDALFRDNIYNVWLNIKEILRYNEGLSDSEKVLDETKVNFYKMILNFDNVTSTDKINLYNRMKNQHVNLEFYNDLRMVKDSYLMKISEIRYHLLREYICFSLNLASHLYQKQDI